MAAVPPETQTANYGWIKPFPTGSTSTWGATVNADLDAIDAQVKTNANAVTAATVGVTNGTDAAAGQIGEFITASRTQASQIALSNTVAANVISITLTAGDWDVWGAVNINGTAPSTSISSGISTVSAAMPAAPLSFLLPTNAAMQGPVPMIRVSSASPTTCYLVSLANFSSGTFNSYGTIMARRVR